MHRLVVLVTLRLIGILGGVLVLPNLVTGAVAEPTRAGTARGGTR